MSRGISHLQGGVLHHHQGRNGRPEVPQQLVPRCVAGVCWSLCGRPAWAPRETLATPPFPFIRHSKEYSSCCDAHEPPSRREDLCILLQSLNPCHLQSAVFWEGHRPAWRGLCPGAPITVGRREAGTAVGHQGRGGRCWCRTSGPVLRSQHPALSFTRETGFRESPNGRHLF